MCGRFVSASPPDEIARYFSAIGASEAAFEELPEELTGPRYNVAPTDDVAVVLEQAGTRRVDALHWGLVPRWAKDPAIASRMINARAETLAANNAFKHAFARRRCLIPADGFYEWTTVAGQKRKQPLLIRRRDGEPLAFAGIWEEWESPDHDGAGVIRSCTIITGPANDLVGTVHDRMPVILPPGEWDAWLDVANRDTDRLAPLLGPAPSEILVMHPVSTDVNDVRNDGAHLINPVEPPAPPSDGQGTLL
ncbi:SOS response-associated peptidase [soil metagenome]